MRPIETVTLNLVRDDMVLNIHLSENSLLNRGLPRGCILMVQGHVFVTGSLQATSFPFALLTPSYFPLPALSLDAEMTYFFPRHKYTHLHFSRGLIVKCSQTWRNSY